MTAEQLDLVTIDFETYYDSDYTLKKMSTSQYVYDPRFETIGVAITRGSMRVWLEDYQFRLLCKQLPWHAIALLAHHSHFDGLILSHHYGVKPGFWYDTLSMARAIHGEAVAADLDSLMRRYGIGQKGHEVIEARGKRRVDFTPAEWQQYGVYSINDCDGTTGLFNRMASGFPQSELELIDITVRMFTEPVMVLDEPKMQEYLEWEIARKEALLSKIGADKKALGSNDKFAALLRDMGVEPPTKDSPTAKDTEGNPKRIFAFAKSDPAFQELLLGGDEDVRLLCEARVGVKSAGNETRTARLLDIGANQRALPVYLKYAGAGTFRWSGGDKMNWQNFQRADKKDPRKGAIRQSIRAPAGHMIIAGDLSQVEARFNAWYNGQQDLIDAFARGEDVYSLFASEVYGRPIDRKNNPDDEEEGRVGKAAILGLGYGMGYLKFGGEMLRGANGGAPVQFVEEDLHKLHIDPTAFLANPKNVERILEVPGRLSPAAKLVHYTVSNYIVDVYRTKNDKIKAGWGFMKEVIDLMYQGYRGPVGKNGIIELVEGGVLLPSGLVMHYRELKYETDENGRNGGYSYLAKRGQRSRLYGPLLVENICQALCRIIMADAMLQLRKEGLRIVSSEHDAIVAAAPVEEAPYWSQRMLQMMATPPAWARGLPLAAEGGWGITMAEAK
ncbi:MAG: DNA polymerase [Burkholderiales bacterium]